MGFWPGGDRDGNPFVKTDTTLKVAESLRTALLRCYYFDVRRLKSRLTFKEVDLIIAEWEEKLYQELFTPDPAKLLSIMAEMLKSMLKIREVLIYQNNGLFLSIGWIISSVKCAYSGSILPHLIYVRKVLFMKKF